MKPQYVTPRLAVATITSVIDLQNINLLIEKRHKGYFHLFNLTNVILPADKESTFKWRGEPFSVSEAVRVMTQMDTFLRINIANTVFLCVANRQMHEYALLIIKCYIQMCLQNAKEINIEQSIKKLTAFSKKIVSSHPYFCQQMLQIYKQVTIDSPPIKILQCLTIQPEQSFIPLVQIWNQSRYNDFQLTYTHSIEPEVSEYYLNLNCPLRKSIGKHYYDQKPETKYFHSPVLVYGDVKIVIYSYKTMKKIHEFTLGFNTLCLETLNKQSILQLSQTDFYEKHEEDESKLNVKIKFTDYCDSGKCKKSASCGDCRQIIKKLSNRYNEVQRDLQRLHRKRTCPQIHELLSIHPL